MEKYKTDFCSTQQYRGRVHGTDNNGSDKSGCGLEDSASLQKWLVPFSNHPSTTNSQRVLAEMEENTLPSSSISTTSRGQDLIGRWMVTCWATGIEYNGDRQIQDSLKNPEIYRKPFPKTKMRRLYMPITRAQYSRPKPQIFQKRSKHMAVKLSLHPENSHSGRRKIELV